MGETIERWMRAEFEGEFVVLLTGAQINKPRAVWTRWARDQQARQRRKAMVAA